MAANEEVKQAKRLHKESMKNQVRFKENRNNLIEHLLKCETPNWNISFSGLYKL